MIDGDAGLYDSNRSHHGIVTCVIAMRAGSGVLQVGVGESGKEARE